MRKMTTEQAKHYILAGFFPKPPCKGDLPWSPISEHVYLWEIDELRNAFDELPVTFCAYLLTDEMYAENAAILFDMIWDDTCALHRFADQIKSNRIRHAELQVHYKKLTADLAETISEMDKLDAEYDKYTAKF